MKPKKINHEVTWIGIDVSKTEHEIHCPLPASKLPKLLPNTKNEISKFITQLRKTPNPHLIFEATGGYEKLLLSLCQEAGIAASRINPSLARNYAKAQGLLAKTDRIDANAIICLPLFV